MPLARAAPMARRHAAKPSSDALCTGRPPTGIHPLGRTLNPLPPLPTPPPPAPQGMAESRSLADFDGRGFSYCLISRKCRLHVGPRYKARGLNETADPGVGRGWGV